MHKENPPANGGLFSNYYLLICVWAHQDSNLEPTHYECGALTVELWAPKIGHKLNRLFVYTPCRFNNILNI